MHFMTLNYPEDKAMKDAIADVIAKTKSASPAEQKKAAAQQNQQAATPAAGGH
jgi:hypothetical protein